MTEQQCRVEETICGPMTVDKRFWQCETTYGLILLFVDRFVRLSPGLVHAVWSRILVVTSRQMDGTGSANCGMTGICDGLCIGLLWCSSREPCIRWGKKEELFYSLSPLFIDTSLLVLVTAIKTGHYSLAFF